MTTSVRHAAGRTSPPNEGQRQATLSRSVARKVHPWPFRWVLLGVHQHTTPRTRLENMFFLVRFFFHEFNLDMCFFINSTQTQKSKVRLNTNTDEINSKNHPSMFFLKTVVFSPMVFVVLVGKNCSFTW